MHVVVNFGQICDPSWLHEGEVVPTSHVVDPLLSQLIGFVPPGEEDWLVVVLAGLVVRFSDFQCCLLCDFAKEPAYGPQFGVAFLDHGNLDSFLFTHDHAHNEVDLLSAHFPVAAEALLNVTDPSGVLHNHPFQIAAHFQAAEK